MFISILRFALSFEFDNEDEEKTKKIDNEYKMKLIMNDYMDELDYNRRLIELLKQNITDDRDPLATDDKVFSSGNIAKGITEPTRPLVVTKKMDNERMSGLLKH